MPIWSISEPNIDLFIEDEPLGYQAGAGPRVSFKLTYKQRTSGTVPTGFFNTGKYWNSSWRTYITDDTPGTAATLYLAGGGTRTYTNGSSFYAGTQLQRLPNDTDPVTGFVMTYNNGAQDVFSKLATSAGTDICLLVKRISSSGQAMRFVYATNSSIVQLVNVIDADGRTNTLRYANVSDASLITSVEDPFHRTNVLAYTSGAISSITDVEGYSSSFVYDGNGYVTNMTTPYGTWGFAYTEYSANGATFGGDNAINRSILVTYPGSVGGKELYMYRDKSEYLDSTHTTEFLPRWYSNGMVPTNTPIGTLDNSSMVWRNTFHWNRQQYAALSTTDMTLFTTNDYFKGTMKHWLQDAYNVEEVFVTPSVSLLALPAAGPPYSGFSRMIWYDYWGKLEPSVRGDSSKIGSVTEVMPDGHTYHKWYEYDSLGHVTSIMETYSDGDSVGIRTNRNVYNGYDLVLQIGPKGETNGAYGYSGHLLVAATNAVGEVARYTYDASGRLTSVKTPSGLTSTNIYFSSGEYTNWVATNIVVEIGRTNSFSYTDGLLSSSTDERGLTITNTYDRLQRLTSTRYPDGTFSNIYNKLDLVAVIDKMGFSNSFGYNAIRQIVYRTNKLGNVWTNEYCDCGALAAIHDPLGFSTTFEHDLLGRVTKQTFADSTYISNVFNRCSQIVEQRAVSGAWTTNAYVLQGLLMTASNSFGQIVRVSYDIEDQPTNVVNSQGVVINGAYDDLGRIVSRSYPDGGVENFVYRNGALVFYTNQLHKVTSYDYNEALWKIAETNANQEVLRYNYDSSGNLTVLTDGNAHHTTWKYDLYGRLTNKLDHFNVSMFLYAYDVNGRLLTRTTPAKGTTTYFYDRVGNLTNVTYPTMTNLYSFDRLGRLTNMNDRVGNTRFSYTPTSQLQTEDGPWSNDTITYAYADGLRQSLSLQQPNTSPWVESYTYDGANRLKTVGSPAGTFSYDYAAADGFGALSLLVQLITLPNGAYITNSYDSNGRQTLTALKNSEGTVLDSYAYGYNLGNQRTNVVRTGGDYVNYTYDNIGQLKTATGVEQDTTPRLHEQFGYSYDAAGNLNNRTNNALVQTFNVNELNELSTAGRSGSLTVAGTTTANATSVSVTSGATTKGAHLYGDATFATTNGFTLANGSNTFTATAQDSYGRTDASSVMVNLPAAPSYQYDTNGNLTNDSRRVFEYDDENQLTAVWMTNTWRSEFVYDGKMRRKVRKEFTWSSGWVQTNEVHYFYDGNLVIQERDQNNLARVSYTRGADLSGGRAQAGGVGGLLARTDALSGASAFYHSDANGNVTAMLNSQQAVVAKYVYDPFGNVVSQAGGLSDLNLYRFASKDAHLNSGLSYYLYRYYDSNIQRWVNRDPFGERGFQIIRGRHRFGVENGKNRYAFVYNDPVGKNDPWGLFTIEQIVSFIHEATINRDYKMIEYWEDELNMALQQQEEARIAREAAEAARLANQPGWFARTCQSVGRGMQALGAAGINIVGALGGLWVLPGQAPTSYNPKDYRENYY